MSPVLLKVGVPPLNSTARLSRLPVPVGFMLIVPLLVTVMLLVPEALSAKMPLCDEPQLAPQLVPAAKPILPVLVTLTLPLPVALAQIPVIPVL